MDSLQWMGSVLSHQSPLTYVFICSCKWCLIWCIFLHWFRQDNFFHWRKCYNGLWYTCRKQRFKVENVLMMNLFITSMQLFISQAVNWWTPPIHCRRWASDGTKVLQIITNNLKLTWFRSDHLFQCMTSDVWLQEKERERERQGDHAFTLPQLITG